MLPKKFVGLTYLNLNDCEVRTTPVAKSILKKAGSIDLLFSQFSYAYWAGNPEDVDGLGRIAVGQPETGGL